jgi:hypothetical protein
MTIFKVLICKRLACKRQRRGQERQKTVRVLFYKYTLKHNDEIDCIRADGRIYFRGE